MGGGWKAWAPGPKKERARGGQGCRLGRRVQFRMSGLERFQDVEACVNGWHLNHAWWLSLVALS